MIKTLSFLISTIVLLTAVSTLAADKVVVVPLNTSTTKGGRLWGVGRPGIDLMTHGNSNGYCTTATGINFSLSKNLETWANAPHVCPAATWVCSKNDLSTASSSCPLPFLTWTYESRKCDGTLYPPDLSVVTRLKGWTANASTSSVTYGVAKSSNALLSNNSAGSCISYRAWCCWR